jgi:hypothetical protein
MLRISTQISLDFEVLDLHTLSVDRTVAVRWTNGLFEVHLWQALVQAKPCSRKEVVPWRNLEVLANEVAPLRVQPAGCPVAATSSQRIA